MIFHRFVIPFVLLMNIKSIIFNIKNKKARINKYRLFIVIYKTV